MSDKSKTESYFGAKALSDGPTSRAVRVRRDGTRVPVTDELPVVVTHEAPNVEMNVSKVAVAEPSKATADVGLLFLANFVHQVVNPMNGVIGTLSNITDGTYSADVVGQKINASRAQLEQCVSLIRNLAYLSDFFFATSDKALRAPINESSISILPQVIIESVQFFQVAAERKQMQIQLIDAQTQYRVSARPELLKQVFINLFDNWLKYGNPSQTIKIETSVNGRNDLLVSLVGTSIGFDGADAENIFTLGFRAQQAKSKVAQGSGIGLHICRQIVEQALGGKIRAEHNRKSEVTTFRITIPRQKWQI
jgi:signal transduction histidine kinase